MNLLTGDEHAIGEPGALSGCGVEFIEPGKCSFAFDFHVDPRHPCISSTAS